MLTAAQKDLRVLIKRANTRLKRLTAAGIKSPAAERALTALGGAQNFNLGKNPTKSYEALVRRAVTRFLKAETSTVSGHKKVEKKRREGIIRAFKDRGVTATEDDIAMALEGAPNFAQLAEIYGVTSDVIQTEFARGADEGKTAEEIQAEIEKAYTPNEEIDAQEWDGGETAYRPLTKEERQTARERRAEIFEDLDDYDDLF